MRAVPACTLKSAAASHFQPTVYWSTHVNWTFPQTSRAHPSPQETRKPRASRSSRPTLPTARAIRRMHRTSCAQKRNSIRSTPDFTIWTYPTHRAPGRILKSRRPSTSCSRRSSRSTLTTRACTSGTVQASALTSRSTARITQRFQPVLPCSFLPCMQIPSSQPAARRTRAKCSPTAYRRRTGRSRCCSVSARSMSTTTTTQKWTSNSTARTIA